MQDFLIEAFLSLFSHPLPSLSPHLTIQVPYSCAFGSISPTQNTKFWLVSNLVQELKWRGPSSVCVSLFTCLFLRPCLRWPLAASIYVWMRMTLNLCYCWCFCIFWSSLLCLLRETEDIGIRKYFQSNCTDHFYPHTAETPQTYFSVSAKLGLFLSIK